MGVALGWVFRCWWKQDPEEFGQHAKPASSADESFLNDERGEVAWGS
jgi:hypothetical protein